LVQVTYVSRHGIYAEFGGKRGLFLACLAGYRATVVDPAFSRVEQPGAQLAQIEQYFEHQISLAELCGLPGSGCLFVNTATELAAHDQHIIGLVAEHQGRLRTGFAEALANTAHLTTAYLTTAHLTTAHLAKAQLAPQLEGYAIALLAFSNGLWALSRTVDNAQPLRLAVKAFLQLIDEGITHAHNRYQIG
jgi:TetR/AcrR family transcriptional regulator, transcriptional repressor for nem operon